jgi:hypothetical protein
VRAMVVYESMFGNTRRLADAVGRGLNGVGLVAVVPVDRADPEIASAVDLLVVGGPTHARGMSRRGTRDAAMATARKPGSALILDPHAHGMGLREWLSELGPGTAVAAAFDTRVPVVFSGHASKGIARELRRRGYSMVGRPVSFLVGTANVLRPGEEDRAVEWGQKVAAAVSTRAAAAQLR